MPQKRIQRRGALYKKATTIPRLAGQPGRASWMTAEKLVSWSIVYICDARLCNLASTHSNTNDLYLEITCQQEPAPVYWFELQIPLSGGYGA